MTGRKASAVTVTYLDGTSEKRPNSSFRKPKITDGCCTRCGQPVRQTKRYLRRLKNGQKIYKKVLLDTNGYAGQEHACPEQVRARNATPSAPR